MFHVEIEFGWDRSIGNSLKLSYAPLFNLGSHCYTYICNYMNITLYIVECPNCVSCAHLTRPSKLAQAVKILACNWELPGSTVLIVSFYEFLTVKCWAVIHTGPRPLPSTSFPDNYSLSYPTIGSCSVQDTDCIL